VDRFQNDPDCRVIVLNLAAGGVGLTLTAASNVAFVELGWTPGGHDQAEDRAHRIGQTDSVTAWYLLGENTIDQDIYALIEEKRAVVTAATDGEIVIDEGSMLNELLGRIAA
jgi:SWI/SNF-related matrix-associated actin-dependent regulator 1 of chromatin subfamily A